MSISAIHPTVYAFKKKEVETLGFLTTRKLLKEYPDLSQQIEFCYYEYKDLNKLKQIDFQFHADFDMNVEGKVHKMILGGSVLGDYNMATYFLGVCDTNKHKSLIRKFHFDYASPTIPTKQPVPIFHLQYGGEATSRMAELEISAKKMDAWLSVPRLSFHPMNLALLLDMTFCEFRTEESNKVVENSDWRSHIKKNEDFLLSPYYRSIFEFTDSQQHCSNRLIRDYCYGR